ncbi:MAG: protein-tyrosine-phosphatase [Bacteroidota bacterium]|nr:protein-tyrosine-phosphatase [Bacteroidota bacterium]
MIYPSIIQFIKQAEAGFDFISKERKGLLTRISHYIADNEANGLESNLVYICTHNSRRSHFGQIWAQVAAEYYGIKHLKSYSGGTEATAFNANAIKAIMNIGFKVTGNQEAKNPIYTIEYASDSPVITCFSKVYDDESNPKSDFCAIMTCSEAEANCPFVAGAVARIATTYDDPKAFDNTPLQDQKYAERCLQIATETLFALSLVK